MTHFTSIAIAAVLAIAARPATTTDLALDLRDATGASTVVVAPGRTVHYQIIGTLSNSASDGLAYFSTNLSFSGGPLSQAATPLTAPMNLFSPPLGFSNPAGFGGTPHAGDLLQVGGAQNTIHNTIAPAPVGPVQLGIAQPGASQVLVTGDLVAPNVVGSYSLSARGAKANVILPGQSGATFYKVDKVGNVNVTSLTVDVQAITARPAVVSVAIGQEQHLALDAGPANAGRAYQCLGSLSGTSPGYQLPGGATLPLTFDGYLAYTLNHPNTSLLQNSQGTLDANGRAVVTFHPDRRFVGKTVNHAFFLSGTSPEFVSEAESVQVVQ